MVDDPRLLDHKLTPPMWSIRTATVPLPQSKLNVWTSLLFKFLFFLIVSVLLLHQLLDLFQVVHDLLDRFLVVVQFLKLLLQRFRVFRQFNPIDLVLFGLFRVVPPKVYNKMRRTLTLPVSSFALNPKQPVLVRRLL